MDSIRPFLPEAVVWSNDHLQLLDQRLLPRQEIYQNLRTVSEVAQAIRTMVVRGAPAIGITAAYGVVLAARDRYHFQKITWRNEIEPDFQLLAAARPTAVNLFWALDALRAAINAIPPHTDPTEPLLATAQQIHATDRSNNLRMGELGAALFTKGAGEVLTHCNAGSLATGGYGTALGVIRSAYSTGRISHVYADETRPWLQGARLTAWELVREGIPVTLLADGAAAHRMATQRIQWVVVGADRIAANGDTANKIGTYALAVAARYHGVRFMVVAPTSTIDSSLQEGKDIPIEVRSPDELLSFSGVPIAAPGAQAWNPSFDITPAVLIDALVTEKGVIHSPNADKIAQLFTKG